VNARARAVRLVALLGLWASAARAQPSVSLALSKTPAGDRAFLVAAADARGAGVIRARLGADYASSPLVVVAADQQEISVVSQQLWLEPGVSFALAHRFLFSLDAPLVVVEAGDPAIVPAIGEPPAAGAPTESLSPGNAPALGDLRVGARMRLLGDADSSWKLAGGATLFIPTASEPWAGDGVFGAKPAVTASVESARLRGALELGFLARASERVPSIVPLRTGSALVFGLATSAAVDSGAELFVGPELSVALGVADGAKLFDPRSTSGQALVGARFMPTGRPFAFALGVGPGIGQAPGAADFRALFSVSYSPEAPPPPPDSDDDRVADERDACPSVPGSASEDPLMNGCPELPTDTDGDAIPDTHDACPRTPGPANVERRLHGCPPPPPKPPPKAELVAEAIVISEQVQFETGTAALKTESDAVLGQVARVLAEHPELELVEVQGHTDNTGTPELNQRLSDDRARAVVERLAAHGVQASRLTAKGYGQERPIADNATEEGRAKNRRVEFRVLRPAKPPETPGGTP
jgi:outer membrane protein OmpA-like peptidoglycan-associated protein